MLSRLIVFWVLFCGSPKSSPSSCLVVLEEDGPQCISFLKFLLAFFHQGKKFQVLRVHSLRWNSDKLHPSLHLTCFCLLTCLFLASTMTFMFLPTYMNKAWLFFVFLFAPLTPNGFGFILCEVDWIFNTCKTCLALMKGPKFWFVLQQVETLNVGELIPLRILLFVQLECLGKLVVCKTLWLIQPLDRYK